MKFDVYGPFEIPYTSTRSVKRVDEKALNDFWRKEALSKLKRARGCYIFATKAKGNTLKPWYIGKAENTPFGKETFNDSNLKKYNGLFHDPKGPKRANPVVFFLPQITGKRSLIGQAGKSKRPAIEWLEKRLIAEAYKANKNLVNTSGTKKLRIEVVGVMNSDRRKSKSGPGKDLRKMLNLR